MPPSARADICLLPPPLPPPRRAPPCRGSRRSSTPSSSSILSLVLACSLRAESITHSSLLGVGIEHGGLLLAHERSAPPVSTSGCLKPTSSVALTIAARKVAFGCGVPAPAGSLTREKEREDTSMAHMLNTFLAIAICPDVPRPSVAQSWMLDSAPPKRNECKPT